MMCYEDAFIVVAFSLTRVSVHPDNSLGVAQTHAALNQRLGLNRVSVPSGTLLRGAMMDGHPAYCTVGPAYFSLADNRAVCL